MAASRGAKGQELEESLKAYFWQAGYFVVRGLPYQLDGEDVTDVDLWLYERPAASTRRRIIVDIKNKKSPKAAERVVWTKGLQAALGVDGAVVATTDSRPAVRRLGKALGLQILDGDAVSKIVQSDKLKVADQLSLDDLNALVRQIDNQRRSSEWRNTLHSARASMITGIGVQSANRNLAASAFFAEQTALAQPSSGQALVGLRLFYLTSALAAISLDFVLADQAFRSPEERKSIIVNAIRFGQSEAVASMPIVSAAISLARKYAENGQATAKQIEYGFYQDADRIPAEFIAEYLAKIARADTLFNVAREVERASISVNVPGYDALSVEARSVLGVFLDFNGISRERIALALPSRNGQSKIAGQPDLGFFEGAREDIVKDTVNTPSTEQQK
ncbi:MAG: hypothetical protein EOQ55_26780 [Mesorhizobium sp.]|uniref:hypothetical protein n=1 Tax=unclassified Mesorhizobium TaxID=325217 RepID=UPI000FC9AF64|nr:MULTISPECIES: hypothetical protein [unclassified Mesorhizobium]RUV41897.1 hypothetical protein EOD29_19900 [Mesorhizobium sp. M1A.T.Ca.IN.004.03.1.1]RWG12541.1 MAG: hypothetical protein EOQ55_26780 [Mesorhizobium sp.]RWI92381.1 MAG: hypothetical protein EOR21_17650 [Mesorhizobium sp.]RWK34559.1 MAG: hypothetical protein EOR40_18055 [Mesorhizobium sp.]RWK87535.1 MAG: hypothetical protein EOR52_16980 [Mesorhizobium sp.]